MTYPLIQPEVFNVKHTFTQSSHGLSVLDAVRLDSSGDWVKSLAEEGSIGYGLVSSVSGDTFDVTFFGLANIPSHGLVVGSAYYVSPITAGLLIASSAADIVHPFLFVLDNSNLMVLAYRPNLGGTFA